MTFCPVLILAIVGATSALAQQSVSFTTKDGVTIRGDLYGSGDRAVVLAHGGRFRREGWAEQAKQMVATGFRVLAIDFRGEGPLGTKDSVEGPRYLDVLGAVHYLRGSSKTVSVVGASMGGDYAVEAAEAEPDQIDRIVLLASGAYKPLSSMPGPKLFIIAREDANDEGPRLPKIRAQFEKAREPKEMIVLEGSAHAQFLFATNQGERVMREILRFLER